jgi:hypothetical protein
MTKGKARVRKDTKMRIFFKRAALSLILLVALVSTAMAGEAIKNCQKESADLTACRNQIEENKALTPAQKQMLEMRLNRFTFIQSILSQARQEKIMKVNPSAPEEDTDRCNECQGCTDHSD